MECFPRKESEAAKPFRPLPPPRQPLEVVSVEMTPTENDQLPARAPREEEIRKHKKQMKARLPVNLAQRTQSRCM